MATPPETLEAPIAEEGTNRNVLIGALAGGIVLVLVLAWFFFLRGGGEEALAPEVAAPTVVPETPVPTETAAEEEDEGRVETFEVFAGRDPFEPLVDEGGGGGGTVVTDEDGTVISDADEGAEPSGASGNVGGHRVRLVDVFPNGRTAQVQVDGTVYTVDEGEVFADNFQLVRASGQCATMLFGDDEFTLCEGEEILK